MDGNPWKHFDQDTCGDDGPDAGRSIRLPGVDHASARLRGGVDNLRAPGPLAGVCRGRATVLVGGFCRAQEASEDPRCELVVRVPHFPLSAADPHFGGSDFDVHGPSISSECDRGRGHLRDHDRHGSQGIMVCGQHIQSAAGDDFHGPVFAIAGGGFSPGRGGSGELHRCEHLAQLPVVSN